MTKIAIVGGGPGGLMTARLLEEKFTDSCETTLFEARARTGGKIVTQQFESAPVAYEAGVAELYDYSALGPDPLLETVRRLGLQTVPMSGQAVVLDGRILGSSAEVARRCGRAAAQAISAFRKRCREALPPGEWYEGDCYFDNTHSWANRSCEDILSEVPDLSARNYLRAAVHSDLATEPYLTNGLNGLKNFLMDVPGYIRLYSLSDGLEALASGLRDRLTRTLVKTNSPVVCVERNSAGGYRVFYRNNGNVESGDFDAVFIALPHNSLDSVEWNGERLKKAMSRFICYYNRPGHYLRISILFRKPFWRSSLPGSWFTLDSFGGCCVYDEGTRRDAGDYGALGWLLAGSAALSMCSFDDRSLVEMALDSLPAPLNQEARVLMLEARVHRWPAAVSAQPGGLPVRDARSAHLPEPIEHPGVFVVGDYLYDSTLNGVLDSADMATDLFEAHTQKLELLKASAGNGSVKITKMGRSYFDEYHDDLTYEDGYDWYFDAKYVRDLIRIVWKARPPYRLLDAGSANGQTLQDFARCGIEAWGVENNQYIQSKTPRRWRRRNMLGDIRRLPFPDNSFDFVYETCLEFIPENQLPRAIQELYRVSRRGVIFSSITSDMNPRLFEKRDLVQGVKALMSLWEWAELFGAHGFTMAATDDKTLARLWRCERKYDDGDDSWYREPDSLRYCFYEKGVSPKG